MGWKIRQWLTKFFYGRYGSDQLNTAVMAFYLLLTVVNIFLRSIILNLIVWLLLFRALYRTLSRNIAARQRENAWFMRIWNRVLGWARRQKQRWQYRKTHVFRRCPGCKLYLRLPRRRGKHTVNCPKCGKPFSVRVLF